MRRRFCSSRCKQQFLEGRIERACPVCGREFEIKIGANGQRFTCSDDCRKAWLAAPPDSFAPLAEMRRRALEQHLRLRPAECEVCGNSSAVVLVELGPRNGQAALLCPSCRAQFEQGELSGEEIAKHRSKVINGVRKRRVEYHSDQRGRLGELFTQRSLAWRTPAHIYLTTVDYGVTKAWHLHLAQTDNFFCVWGRIQLALCDARIESPTFGSVNQFILGEGSPLLVQIPPGVLHGFKGLWMPHSLVLNMADRVYRLEDPDEIRVAPHPGPEQRQDLERLEIPLEQIPFSWTQVDG